jgi:hypothetical protein
MRSRSLFNGKARKAAAALDRHVRVGLGAVKGLVKAAFVRLERHPLARRRSGVGRCLFRRNGWNNHLWSSSSQAESIELRRESVDRASRHETLRGGGGAVLVALVVIVVRVVVLAFGLHETLRSQDGREEQVRLVKELTTELVAAGRCDGNRRLLAGNVLVDLEVTAGGVRLGGVHAGGAREGGGGIGIKLHGEKREKRRSLVETIALSRCAELEL